MKHCPRAVSIARPSTLQPTALPSELAVAPPNINGSANFYELWAPNINRLANFYDLWAENINGSTNFYELWAVNINGSALLRIIG